MRYGVDDLFLQPGAVAGCVGWVFGELGGADDVGDCGEGTVFCSGVEVIEGLADHAFGVEGGAGESFLELAEPGQGVVVKVVNILEDGPGDSGILVELGSGFPGQRVAVEIACLAAGGLVVVDIGIAAF